MAGLPPITQLGGNHKTLFDGYWGMLDPQATGQVEAASAAAFLKKSQLREPVLHKIWSMSDVTSRGYLDKQGLFMALRLIAVCQAGKQPSVANMALSDPPPTFAGIDPPVTLVANKWTVDDSERAKQEQVFQSLHPVKGLLAGDKARPFMITSNLPRDTLGKIWNLSDIDKDGSLDLDEFCVATKLISLAKGGEVLPAILPPSLIPPSKVKGGKGTSTDVTSSLSATSLQSDSPSSHSSPLPARKGSATPISVGVEWVVTAEMKTKYDGYFQGIDKDQDGYVSGEQARNLFMASNLQQPVLAHIWNLCDIEHTGKLNAEQFSLAMYLIAEKVRNKDVPKELTPAMIPPSLRGKVTPLPTPAPPTSTTSTAVTMDTMWGATSLPGASTGATPTANEVVGSGFGNDFSAIQELDNITSEIDSIRKEKVELADDIKAKQELIQQKKGELEVFQDDIQQVTKRREALEKEREEARAKLDHLTSEKAKFEGQIAEVQQNCDDEREEIERLKAELSAQETSNRSKAEELEKLQQQLEELKKEEQEYRQKVEMSKVEMDKFHKANNNLTSEITQVRQRIEGLKEEQQSLATVMTLYPTSSSNHGNSASSGVVNINDVGKLSAELHVPHLADHDAISARATAGSSSPVSSLSGFSTNSHLDEGADEGVAKDDKTPSDPFAPTTSSSRDPFTAFSLPNTEDSFGGRSFSGKPSVLSAFDPFGGSGGGGGGGGGDDGFDPFKSTGPTLAPATGEDMFRTGDPFSGSSSHISNSSSSSSLPPIAPASNLATVDPFSGQDPFKTDPFGSASKETSVQPTSLWGNTGGFDVDPFGQQQQTPTDPFASGDPFGEDPFATKSAGNPFASSSGGGASGGGGATFGGGLWKQDGQNEHKS